MVVNLEGMGLTWEEEGGEEGGDFIIVTQLCCRVVFKRVCELLRAFYASPVTVNTLVPLALWVEINFDICLKRIFYTVIFEQ